MENLSILNGGFYKWLKEINEIESSNSDAAPQEVRTNVDTAAVKMFDRLERTVHCPDE